MPDAQETPKPLKRWMHWRRGFPGGPGLLIIYERKSRKRTLEAPYILVEVPKEESRAFRLTKVGKHGDPDSLEYTVEVKSEQEAYCECRSYLLRGYCRHILAVRKLLETRKL